MCGFFNRKSKFPDINSDIADNIFSDKKVEKVDMNNIIHSIFHAESLYNKLKTKCHPDRFAHDELLMSKADDLFKEITENKRNFNKLQELQQVAEKELNITL
jgi:hypothetical protein